MYSEKLGLQNAGTTQTHPRFLTFENTLCSHSVTECVVAFRDALCVTLFRIAYLVYCFVFF